MNKDIFYSSKNNLSFSSSIFSSETPSYSMNSEITDTEYLNNIISKFEKELDTPIKMHGGKKNKESTLSLSTSDSTSTSDTTSESSSTTSTRYTSETVKIPNNYSESSTTISPFYSSDYKYVSESSYSTTSEKPKKKKTTKRNKNKK